MTIGFDAAPPAANREARPEVRNAQRRPNFGGGAAAVVSGERCCLIGRRALSVTLKLIKDQGTSLIRSDRHSVAIEFLGSIVRTEGAALISVQVHRSLREFALILCSGGASLSSHSRPSKTTIVRTEVATLLWLL